MVIRYNSSHSTAKGFISDLCSTLTTSGTVTEGIGICPVVEKDIHIGHPNAHVPLLSLVKGLETLFIFIPV